MKDLKEFLKLPLLHKNFDLQLFADGGEGEESGDEPQDDPLDDEDDDKSKKDKDGEKKYTDEDLNKIIDQKFSKWQKKQEEAEKKAREAERLKNMTAQEKREHEFKELQEKIARYEKQEALSEMTKVARGILSDEGINVNDTLIVNLVSEDAETTKANVENFVDLFQKAVQKEVADRLKHESPKKKTQQSKLTKEDIMKIQNRAERQRLIAENVDLFK